jgi:hypothetical protein
MGLEDNRGEHSASCARQYEPIGGTLMGIEPQLA